MKSTTILTALLLTTAVLWSAPDDSIPLELKELDCVIYIDGTQAAGEQPAGLSMLLNLADAYQTYGLKGTITAVFDDDATPIILNNAAYDTQTKTSDGNPHAETIAGLLKRGVVLAVCGNDLESKSLTAENLLPGVKTTPRGILLVAQLARDGAFTVPTPLPGAQPKD
jgi:intracellular sulfur oxidation DsrE/DsrF family protein